MSAEENSSPTSRFLLLKHGFQQLHEGVFTTSPFVPRPMLKGHEAASTRRLLPFGRDNASEPAASSSRSDWLSGRRLVCSVNLY